MTYYSDLLKAFPLVHSISKECFHFLYCWPGANELQRVCSTDCWKKVGCFHFFVDTIVVDQEIPKQVCQSPTTSS